MDEWGTVKEPFFVFRDAFTPFENIGGRDFVNRKELLPLIDKQQNAPQIKHAYDIVLIYKWWKHRYREYLRRAASYGHQFNKLTDSKLCEELRDRLFGTSCNEFPDWRTEEDKEAWQAKMKKWIENKKVIEMIDEIAAGAEAAKTN